MIYSEFFVDIHRGAANYHLRYSRWGDRLNTWEDTACYRGEHSFCSPVRFLRAGRLLHKPQLQHLMCPAKSFSSLRIRKARLKTPDGSTSGRSMPVASRPASIRMQ